MTKEETKEMWNSIEKLSELRSNYSCFDKEEEPYYRALSLGIKGIKALEQEPCNDCVSREQALSAIRNLYPSTPFVRMNLKKWQEENKKYFECEDIIKALPPVTPTRKSGLHWIERFDNESMWLECPHCHMDSIAAYNYCPNCGASFKEEKRGNSDGSN